ncbi:MAG: hypothetical protein KGO81_14975 [Bacteroidota bacterium]|nr:hypothetical protein [Bacteroidota bacterium]
MKKIFSLFVFIFIIAAAHAQDADSTLNQYVGNYTFPAGGVISYVNIVFTNGSLSYTSDGGEGVLVKQAVDTFSAPAHSGKVYFTRGDDKKIKGIVIDAMGYHMEGIKAETAAMLNKKEECWCLDKLVIHQLVK